MSVIEIYNPKFDEFHGRSMVTWSEKSGAPRIAENLLDQYRHWRTSRAAKDEPHPAFWEANGPAIARALGFCGAKALVFNYVTDRKVSYRWFGPAPRDSPGNPGWFCICSVSAEGGTNGSDTRVTVTLPTDEDVVFMFHWKQMQSWLKPKPVEYACARCMKGFADKAELDAHASTICEKPEPPGPDYRFGEG